MIAAKAHRLRVNSITSFARDDGGRQPTIVGGLATRRPNTGGTRRFDLKSGKPNDGIMGFRYSSAVDDIRNAEKSTHVLCQNIKIYERSTAFNRSFVDRFLAICVAIVTLCRCYTSDTVKRSKNRT